MWLFLGDSLTEGIGKWRVSYVSELVTMLRQESADPVHQMRLRRLDFSNAKDLSFFNLAGYVDHDPRESRTPHWILNLAAEGSTIRDDCLFEALLPACKIERVFILRGPLESIVRPYPIRDGCWPVWVPRSWRSYSALDPRCYFSAGPLRYAKQKMVDHAKQFIRLRLLVGGGAPIIPDVEFLDQYERLLNRVIGLGARVTALAIPPVDGKVFPGTPEIVERRNNAIRDLCAQYGVDCFSWNVAASVAPATLFCRDGFHPSELGAKQFAQQLMRYLHQVSLR